PIMPLRMATTEARRIHPNVITTLRVGLTPSTTAAMRKLEPIPKKTPMAQTRVDSWKIRRTIYPLEAPSDLRMPISRVRSVIVVYIDRKITRTPTQSEITSTALKNAFNPGIFDGDIRDSYSLKSRIV